MGKLKDALARQKAHGESLREWLQDRAKKAAEYEKEKTKEFRSRPRGVDRVPDRLKFGTEPPKVIVAHEDDNYESRRRMAKFSGGRVERVPREDIPAFKARPGYKPKASKGRKIKGTLRPSTNRPHINPARSKFKA